MKTISQISNVRFRSQDGTEVPSVTGDQMREVDRIAMQETGPNLFQMMENAGRNLTEFAIQMLGRQWECASLLVMAGSGGNGGGGICAARHLANRGLNVRLCLAEPGRMSEIAQWQRRVFQHAGGEEIVLDELVEQQPQIIIDALIGYGLKSNPNPQVTQMIEWANNSRVPILALDIPSGRDATTGIAPGVAIRPQWTMTLALPKTGLVGGAGDLYLADIGIPKQTYERMKLKYRPPFGDRYWVRLETVPSVSVQQ
jgi:NAD(P)H-hydrate epimerase